MQLKLSSINTIYVKQQRNADFFIFNFTLKYMLGNLYIKVYIVGKVFPILSISLLYPKESFTSNFKTARKKDFSMGQLPIDSYMLLYKQNNYVSINKCLVFNLIAIETKNPSFYRIIYI